MTKGERNKDISDRGRNKKGKKGEIKRGEIMKIDIGGEI